MDAPGGHQSIEEFIGSAQKQDEAAGQSTGFIVTSAASAVTTNGLCAGERSTVRHEEQPVDEEDRSAELLLRLQESSVLPQVRDGAAAIGDHPGQHLDIAALRQSLSGRPRLKRVCHICGRECPSRHKLQRHLSTHSEERPYNCTVCGKAFKWTEYLAKHMRTQHSQGSSANNSNGPRNPVLVRNFSATVQPEGTTPRDEPGHRGNGDLSSSNCQQLGREHHQHPQQPPQQQQQTCTRHCSTGCTSYVDAGQGTRPYSLGDEVTQRQPSHLSAQEFYPSNTAVSKANVAVTADFGTPLSQPLHQPASTETGSLLYSHTPSYTPPAIATTIPLSHPDFNQVQTNHHTFNPTVTDALSSSCQPITHAQDLERPLTNGMNASYTTSSYSLPPPPPLISQPAVTPTQNCHHPGSLAPAPCAYHMNSQTDPPADSYSAQYSNPPPPSLPTVAKTSSNVQTQRRPPIKIINLSTKKNVGVQCEVGHETLQALFEEETAMALSAHGRCDSISSDILVQEDELCGSVFDGADSICKFACEYNGCMRSYVHRKDLVRHMKVAHKISPKLLEPQVIESPAKPNICSVGNCGKSYYHLKDLRRHQRQCHAVTIAAVSPRPEEVWESGGSLRYPCDYSGCTKSYIHKKDLVRHKRMFHCDNSTHPTVPNPVVVVTTKRKESVDSNSESISSSPDQPSTRRKRFRLDSSAEPQSSPNLPISNLQPGHSLEADLAALSASSIMDNLSVVAGIVNLPTSLFNIPSTMSGALTSPSILTADGDVQQLLNTLPTSFCSSVVPSDASATEHMATGEEYPTTHMGSFPESAGNTTILGQYSPMQESYTEDTHTTNTVSTGILSHVS